jgi:hypothetical protein
MAKNPNSTAATSATSGSWVKRGTGTGRFSKTSDGIAFKGVRREILFPTEPSTIGEKKIDRAVGKVISRKK